MQIINEKNMLIRRKGQGPLISSSCSHPALRMLILIGIFAMTASAFWWHFERRMNIIAPPAGIYAIVDESDSISKNELKTLYSWRDAFEKKWGIPVFLQVSAKELQIPKFSAGTLFVGVGLEHKEASIVFPSLVRKALGEGLRILAEEELKHCIKDKSPGYCLDVTMKSLWDGF